MEDAILGMKQRSGTTATVDAIKHVKEKVLGGPGSRLNDPDTASIVFVITDGKCNQRGYGKTILLLTSYVIGAKLRCGFGVD